MTAGGRHWLGRRCVLALLGGMMAGVAPLRAEPTSGEALEFVREFYGREAARHRARRRMTEQEFLSAFTARAQQVWRTAQANRNRPNAPVGPILHAFFGRGVLPGHDVQLSDVLPGADGAVTVSLMVQGDPRRIVVHVAKDNGRWAFADFDYAHGDSFLGYYGRFAVP